jgi:hypothetical protein
VCAKHRLHPPMVVSSLTPSAKIIRTTSPAIPIVPFKRKLQRPDDCCVNAIFDKAIIEIHRPACHHSSPMADQESMNPKYCIKPPERVCMYSIAWTLRKCFHRRLQFFLDEELLNFDFHFINGLFQLRSLVGGNGASNDRS